MAEELDPQGVESRALLEAAEFDGARVLKVGSGDGRLAFRYAGASAFVVGIEPVLKEIGSAFEACPSDLRRRVSFVQATALDLPFRTAASTSRTLIDLRPVPAQCPIEVVAPRNTIQVGEADASGMAADAAADRAIGYCVQQGWFVLQDHVRFDFDLYWDSVREMTFFIADSVRMRNVLPPAADLEKAHRELAAGERGRVRVRCRRPTMLAVYDKATPRD